MNFINNEEDDAGVLLDEALTSTSKSKDRGEQQEKTPTNIGYNKSEIIITRESLKRKYGNSPLPDPLPFPDNFSVAVQQAIKSGFVITVRRQLVNDIGSFYMGITSTPQQGDYKRRALLICQKFPELRDTTPSNYCVSHNFMFLSNVACSKISLGLTF